MRDRYLGIFLCVLVGLAIVLGGSGFGVIGNTIVQLLSLPAIFIAIVRLSRQPLDGWIKAALVLVAMIHALPLFQLIPLSPATWTTLPGRGWIAQGYRQLGMALPRSGISLSPEDTLAWWLHLFPATSAFLLGLCLPTQQRRWVAWTIVALALVSVLLGIVQVTTGWGYIYRWTNIGSAVGFFANRNHLATLLVMAIPLTMLLIDRRRGFADIKQRWAAAFAIFALIVPMLLGILTAGSRAGVGLSLVGIVMAMLSTVRWPETVGRWVPAAAALALVVAGVAVSTVARDPLVSSAERAVSSEMQDKRIRAIPLTTRLGWTYFPWGSGLGTFDATFRTSGGDINLEDAYLNHAHNDYLETWLTAGLPGVMLIAILILFYFGLLGRAWRSRSREKPILARVAGLSIGLAVVHCLVDYPLRTIADATVFGVLAAFMFTAFASSARPVSARKPETRITVIE